MWRRRRRLQRLEAEIAKASADRTDLRHRLEHFEMIAAAAGAAQRYPVPSEPLPPSLVTAASDARAQDIAVRLDIGAAEVIAVVGGGGDPREWWTAIWRAAGPQAEAGLIRLRMQALPRGLSAILRGDEWGALEVLVSQALPPERQRAAVRVALRSARGAGWRTRLAPGLVVPIPIAAILSSGQGWLRGLTATLRTHALLTAAATTGVAVVAGATLIAVVPHHPAQVSAGRPPATGQVRAPSAGRAPVSPEPSGGIGTQPASRPVPASGQASAAPAPTTRPTAPASSPPAPSAPASSAPATQPPSPSPSPSPAGGGSHCVVLLGLWICRVGMLSRGRRDAVAITQVVGMRLARIVAMRAQEPT